MSRDSELSVAQLLQYGRQFSLPHVETVALVAHGLSSERSVVMAFPERQISIGIFTRIKELIERRAEGIPFAYLVGEREFWSLPFKITPDVLIPRPETELLVEAALTHLLESSCTVLDLGTGSGCVAAALAFERPTWSLVAADVCPAALSIARENAVRLALPNIRCIQSQWYDGLPTDVQYDAIVSNPPYLSEDDPYLSTDIRHEPRRALVSGPNGLEAYIRILDGAKGVLKPGGLVLLEHGATQAQELIRLLCEAGYIIQEELADLQGHARVLVAQFPRT